MRAPSGSRVTTGSKSRLKMFLISSNQDRLTCQVSCRYKTSSSSSSLLLLLLLLSQLKINSPRLEKRAVVFACLLLDSTSQPFDDLRVGIPAVLGRHDAARTAHAVCNTRISHASTHWVASIDDNLGGPLSPVNSITLQPPLACYGIPQCIKQSCISILC